jgi:hypothetical protein
VLPVQCLCEFLLNDSLSSGSSASSGGAKKQRSKAGELLVHLQQLLQNPNSDPASCLETLDYFLRRLASLQSPARLQVRTIDISSPPSTAQISPFIGGGLCAVSSNSNGTHGPYIAERAQRAVYFVKCL